MTFDAGAIEARLILDRHQFQTDLAAAQAEGDKFDGTEFAAKATLNIDQVKAAIAKVAAEWQALRQQLDRGAKLNVDPGDVLAKISEVEAAFEAMRSALSQEVTVKADANVASQLAKQLAGSGPVEQAVTLNTDQAYAALQDLQNKYLELQVMLEALKVDVNTDAFDTAMGMAIDAVNKLKADLASGNVLEIDNARALAAIAATQAAFTVLKRTMASSIPLGVVGAAATAPGGGGGNNNFFAAGIPAGNPYGGGGGGGGGAAAAAGAAGAAAGGAAAQFRVFGGAIGGTIGVVSTLHLVVDLLVEGLIAVVGASAAAATGLAALAATATDVYNHISAVNQVNSALGDQIPVLGGSFRKMAESVQTSSQGLEIYGGLVSIASAQSGIFAQVGSRVVTMFTDWVAKLDLWSQGQHTFQGLLNAGIGFLSQFAGIFAKLGVALNNLLSKDPGTAHFLLDIISAAASLLDLVTRLPAPILETALAMHAWYVYGGAALGILGRMVPAVGGISKALQGLSHGQVAIIAAIAVGAFEMARAWNTASPQVQADIAGIMREVNNLSASQAVGTFGIPQAIGQLNKEIGQVNLSSIQQQWKGWSSIFQETDDRLITFGHDLHQIFQASTWGGFFSAIGNVFHALQPGFSEHQAEMYQEQQDIAHLKQAIQDLLGESYNLDREIGVLTTKGYTVSQSLALMDLAGVKAGDSFALMQQKVTNLIQGYADMGVKGNLLAGSVNAITFATEQQQSQVAKITAAYTTWFNTISGGVSGFATFGTDLAALDTQMKLGTSNLGGFTAANFQAQSQFVTTANGAQTLYNNLLTLTSAAGLADKGTGYLTQAMKDLLQILIPAAQGNVALQTTLVGMAQEVNPNITSFKQLAQWVGNTQNPMQNLNQIMQILTKDAGNLTTDVQNLAVALHQDLTGAMANAELAASNADGTLTAFAEAVVKTGSDSVSTQRSALALAESLVTMSGNVSDAKTQFYAFAEGALHLTQQQADVLWKQTLPGLQGFINSMHGKNLDITMNGIGDYNIQQGPGSVVAKSQGPGGSGSLGGGLAAGGRILGGTGPTADDVLVRVSKDETIVSARDSAVLAPAFSALGIPGYAQGGYVGGVAGLSNFAGGMYQTFQDQMTMAMVTAMRAAIKVAEAAAARASAASANAGISGVSNASGIAAITSAAAKHGWFGALLQDWFGVEAREDASMSLTATNPTSGAYGMAQFINGPSEYYQYGGNPNTYAGQATAMGNYIAQRYTNPAGALAHEIAHGWYDNGGILPPGLTLAFNGTGQNETVTPAGMDPSALSGNGTNVYVSPGAFVGNFTGVVSPVGGGFGLTDADLGIAPSTGTGAGGGAGGSAGVGTSTATGTGTGKTTVKKAIISTAQKAAIAVLRKLMSGYIWHNEIGEADQANKLLNAFGITGYDHTLNEIRTFDALLLQYRKNKKDKALALSAEHILSSFGVHVFDPNYGTKGDAPKSAVIKKLESLLRGDISVNNMTTAGQANSLLNALGVTRYDQTLSTINNLDMLLKKYEKAKNEGEVRAVETLLRNYGVRKFDQGGEWPNMTLGANTSGRSETVLSGQTLDDLVTRLDMLVSVANKQLNAAHGQPRALADQMRAAIMQAPMNGPGLARRYPTNR